MGSSGHLGEALVRTLRAAGVHVTGLDVKKSQFTNVLAPFMIVKPCMPVCKVQTSCTTRRHFTNRM